MDPGGEPKKRGKGTTKPGTWAALMPMRLADFGPETGHDVVQWYAQERKRNAGARRGAVAMFWLSARHARNTVRLSTLRARASRLADVLPAANPRKDALEIDQLPGWFAGVRKLNNRVAAVYLQALLVTGARREEMAALPWHHVDFRWKKLTIADKVDATRTIPLAPYQAWLLSNLPRTSEYVFATDKSVSGRLTEPRSPHALVLADAGIPHVSIHGLSAHLAARRSRRRSCGQLRRSWTQAVGVGRRHRPRSIDVLRPYLARIEQFIPERADVAFDPDTAAGESLRVVHA